MRCMRPTPMPEAADSVVKQRLIDNTEEALRAGVFGVPTFVVRGELFWGADTIDVDERVHRRRTMFERGEMRRAAELEFGAQRRS